MKKIICFALAAIFVCLTFVGCSKMDEKELDAVLDYYVVRLGKDITKGDIKYEGIDSETGKSEFHVENEDAGIDETVYVSPWSAAYCVYNEEGIRVHIFSPGSEDAE